MAKNGAGSLEQFSRKRKKMRIEDDDDNLSESLSDIDDAEIRRYIHSKPEMIFKKLIWESMNKDYQKGKQQKGVSRMKKPPPVKKTAASQTKMQNEKRFSSKINYDALNQLMNQPEEVPEKSKEEIRDPNSSRCNDSQRSNQELSLEAQSLEEGENSDEFEDDNEYNEYTDANIYYENWDEEDGLSEQL
ncbi:hypothetical protein SLE2022_307080 [Rubroshorea leprosula]